VAVVPFATYGLKLDAQAIWLATYLKDTNTVTTANSDETFLSVSSVWATLAQTWVPQRIDGPEVNNDGSTKEKIS
jgi:hypothetical protein